jgi:hypothetical protein
LQQDFLTGQANCVANSSDRACGVGRVYRCHSCSFNVAGGCTTLIKGSLVYHAYEKIFKRVADNRNMKRTWHQDVGFKSYLYRACLLYNLSSV